MNGVSTDWPWMLPLALVIAGAMWGAVAVSARRKRARLARFAPPALLARLAPPTALGGGRWHAARLVFVMALAGGALAGPRWGNEPTVVSGEGIDIVLALDASLSMLATDERPSRLERLKQEVRRYRDLARTDRIAMLAFAGRSYILTPLTVDDGALELFLDNLDPSIVGQAGSSLARAIVQGTDLLVSSRGASDRALVVMSDGEAFEPLDEIRDAASRAAEQGIALVTVGFGTANGSTIPVPEAGTLVPKRDDQGNVVITRYHAETLQAIAEAGRGTFIEAEATDKATRVRAALRGLRATSRTVAAGASKTPRFQWLVAPALLLLALDTWRSERRRRRRTTAPPAPVRHENASRAAVASDDTSATAVRRGAVALLALTLVGGCSWSGSVTRDAARAYAVGRPARAATLYRAAITRGDTRPELYYNLGTALVQADSVDVAVEPMERAAREENAELRFRAWFNQGLGYLRRGLAGASDADSTREALAAALAQYKKALILRPEDRDAKWNYELALRRQEENGGGGGGGGGGSDQQQDREPDASQAQQPSGGLGEQQAEQLLNAAAREERGVQGRKQRQSRPQPPPGGKDW